MRMKLYYFLVNRHAGIRSRYHRVHDNSRAVGRILSYLYLVWLNFCYYVLHCRFLDRKEDMAIYEEKRLSARSSESEARKKGYAGIDEVAGRLMKYDVISFDIFDTLLLRPFSEPADLFFFSGAELGLLDIRRIRMEQEEEARKLCERNRGNRETDLCQIWNRMEQAVGIPADVGIELEQELEEKFCYANPFILKVYEKLRENGKRIIAVSDMYLSGKFLKKLLEQNGFRGIEKLYVSCEYGCSKGDGGLFRIVRSEYPKGTAFIHVGDNPVSDIRSAQKCGLHTLYYPNVNRMSPCFRAYDMSPVIGGAYRGIVNNHLYSGICSYSAEYEYGFIYGGLFVLGYCNFIHKYCVENRIDRILFLSRDGDILKQVYERMYPEEKHTEYVYWSRAAATKLMAGHNRYDYFRRYLYHKVNQGITWREVLDEMELGELADKLASGGNGEMPDGGKNGKPGPEDVLTDRNAEALKEFLLEHYKEIENTYAGQNKAAKQFFSGLLSGVRRAVAVDIGWAGSGAMALRYLVEKDWEIPCRITGLVAGTNTLHNSEPDASEIFLQMGVLKSYLFSQAHNRDVLKKHDPGRDYNVYWELLLASPTRQFLGFGMAPDGSVELHFGEADANLEGIREIQRGILDFTDCYLNHFSGFPYMLDISGRDACAPMLLATSYREKYLKRIRAEFDFKIGI